LSPVFVYHAFRARSIPFFTAVNPTWKYGGMFGESKKTILDQIPEIYKPTTILVENGVNFQDIELQNKLDYPFIAKPILGERGRGVSKINNRSAFLNYHQNSNEAYIIQEFIEHKLELGVFYSRKPSESKGVISSVTLKSFLSVTGDGKNTLHDLILANDRARFQLSKLETTFAEQWNNVIPEGQTIELESIGNHCRGTRFINANYLITNELEQVFEKISHQIEGFQYGRFDFRVSSLEDLYQGKNIKILELNGTNSEPTHIYDPSHGFFKAYRDMAWHWTRIADICIENQKSGIKTASLISVLTDLKSY
jgi:hypothetical protein